MATMEQQAFTGRTVTVAVSPDVAYDMKKMQKVTATLLGRLGCPGCHSGFDIRFRQLLDFVVNPKTLELESERFSGIR
jgi:hypothetical protein